jgi:hypothetical protein
MAPQPHEMIEGNPFYQGIEKANVPELLPHFNWPAR